MWFDMTDVQLLVTMGSFNGVIVSGTAVSTFFIALQLTTKAFLPPHFVHKTVA